MCPVCFAAVEAAHLDGHLVWHATHSLHASDCALHAPEHVEGDDPTCSCELAPLMT